MTSSRMRPICLTLLFCSAFAVPVTAQPTTAPADDRERQRLADAVPAGAAAAPERAQEPGEYFIAGVERSGIYALNPKNQIRLSQAVIAAGGADLGRKHVILVRRSPAHDVNRSMTLSLKRLLAREMEDPVLELGDVLLVVDAPPEPPAKPRTYRIEGEVPRPAECNLSGRRINLLQALVAAGANPATMDDKFVGVYRDRGDGEHTVFRGKVIELVDHRDGGIDLEPGDRIVVSNQPIPLR